MPKTESHRTTLDRIMRDGKWRTVLAIYVAFRRIRDDILITDGTLMRRVREMPNVEKRRIPGTRTWEYRVRTVPRSGLMV